MNDIQEVTYRITDLKQNKEIHRQNIFVAQDKRMDLEIGIEDTQEVEIFENDHLWDTEDHEWIATSRGYKCAKGIFPSGLWEIDQTVTGMSLTRVKAKLTTSDLYEGETFVPKKVIKNKNDLDYVRVKLREGYRFYKSSRRYDDDGDMEVVRVDVTTIVKGS